MADFQPAPTWAPVIVVDDTTKLATFSPVWLKWFLDLSEFLNGIGGISGVDHNLLTGLQGGIVGEYYHLTQVQHQALGNLGGPIGDTYVVFSDAGVLNGEATFTWDGTVLFIGPDDGSSNNSLRVGIQSSGYIDPPSAPPSWTTWWGSYVNNIFGKVLSWRQDEVSHGAGPPYWWASAGEFVSTISPSSDSSGIGVVNLGIYGGSYSYGANAFGQLYGGYVEAGNFSTYQGAVYTAVYGFNIFAFNRGDGEASPTFGNIGAINALYLYTENFGGVSASTTGIYSDVFAAGGTLSIVNGIRSNVWSYDFGGDWPPTVTDWYNLYVYDYTDPGLTVDNLYGIYIDFGDGGATFTNPPWGIYQNDARNNWLKGNLYVGEINGTGGVLKIGTQAPSDETVPFPSEPQSLIDYWSFYTLGSRNRFWSSLTNLPSLAWNSSVEIISSALPTTDSPTSAQSIGLVSSSYSYGSNRAPVLVGLYTEAANFGTYSGGSPSGMYGATIAAFNGGDGAGTPAYSNIGGMLGAYIYGYTLGGTVTDLNGVYAEVDAGGGAITNAYPLLGILWLYDGGDGSPTITNAYALRLITHIEAGTTVDNDYGIYLDGTDINEAPGASWGIYQVDSRINHLNGPLELPAGTTAKAPLNLPAGSAPSSPVEGDLWYDGTNLKFQDSGTTRTITWT